MRGISDRSLHPRTHTQPAKIDRGASRVMSDEKKTKDDPVDPELNELLDSALADFDKPLRTSAKDKSEGHRAQAAHSSDDDSAAMEEEDDDWFQAYASLMTDQLLKFMDDGPMMENMTEKFASAMKTDSPTLDIESSNFEATLLETINHFDAATKNFKNGPTSEDLSAMFFDTFGEDFSDPEEASGIFMRGMMHTVLSKHVMQPLKELVDKYPAYLEKNQAKLPSADLERYRKQQSILEKICEEQAKGNDTDSKDVKKQCFNTVLGLLGEMEKCGRPPVEIAGDQSKNPLFKI